MNPCPLCPIGFEYLTSNGNSTRESGQLQLRRRLTQRLYRLLLYTYSKSIDDDSSLGGQGAATPGQRDRSRRTGVNLMRRAWAFHLRPAAPAELHRAVHHRHGQGGGTLLSGWRGRVYKEWTLQTQINVGSGLPETPLDTAVVVAGYSAFVRPNVTGASLYSRAAWTVPESGGLQRSAGGQWGNARRDSIIGPNQFTLNASMVRTFRLPDKLNLDLQIASANAFNHVTYTSWYTTSTARSSACPQPRSHAHCADIAAAEVLTYDDLPENIVILAQPESLYWRCAAALAITSVSRAQVVGQNKKPGGDTTYTMSVSTKLVIEAVNVKDKQGNSINGLTAKDFTVTEDGVAQKISFCRVPGAAHQRPSPRLPSRRRRTSQSTTGWPSRRSQPEKPGDVQYKDKRLIAIYFDMTAMPPGDKLRALQAAEKFIRTQMTSADLVSHHALRRRLGGCAAGLYRRPQPAAQHPRDADRRRKPADAKTRPTTPAAPIPAQPSARTTASSTSSTPTASSPRCRPRPRCWAS